MSTEKSSTRRRPTRSTNGAKPEIAEDSAPASRPRRTPRPRIETAPITDDFIGKKVTGTICDVIRAGPERRIATFGFINLSDSVEADEKVPRIYFKRSEYSDEVHFVPRRGYFVEFTVNKDEEGRFYASSVQLTAKGHEEADAMKLRADSAKAARAATAPSAPEESGDRRAPRSRDRPRKPIDETVAKLRVIYDLQPTDEKEIDVKIGGSIGFLKRELVKLFNTSGDYLISYIAPGSSEGTLLTGAILKTLKDGDTILFSKAKETADTA